MGCRGEGMEREGEGGRERVGGWRREKEDIFKKWFQLEVRKETKGFPVKCKMGGLRVQVRGSLSALFIAQELEGKKNNKAKESLAYIHYSHPKHSSSSPHKDLKLPQTPSLFLSLSLSVSWQVGSNPATDPAQVPDQDSFWVKGRTRWLLAPPKLLKPGCKGDVVCPRWLKAS